jgi:protein-disulfide isomerase
MFHDDEWKKDQDWLKAARAVGIADLKAFADCLKNPITSKRVQDEVALGGRVGVLGTPTFLSQNGRLNGPTTVANLEKLVGL